MSCAANDCFGQSPYLFAFRATKKKKVNVTGFFPDDYVESPSLFKRKGLYYLTYGSCCCGCAEGGGQVVFTAKAVEGPWVRQTHADINCNNATAKVE